MSDGREAFWLEVPEAMGEGKSISFHSAWERWERRVQQGGGVHRRRRGDSTPAAPGKAEAADQLLAQAITGQLNSERANRNAPKPSRGLISLQPPMCPSPGPSQRGRNLTLPTCSHPSAMHFFHPRPTRLYIPSDPSWRESHSKVP